MPRRTPADDVRIAFDYDQIILTGSKAQLFGGAAWTENGQILVPAGIHGTAFSLPGPQLQPGHYQVEVSLSDALDHSEAFSKVTISTGATILVETDILRSAHIDITIDRSLDNLVITFDSDGRGFYFSDIKFKPVVGEQQHFDIDAGATNATNPEGIAAQIWRALHERRYDRIPALAASAEQAGLNLSVAERWARSTTQFTEIDTSTERLLQENTRQICEMGLSVSALRLNRQDRFLQRLEIARAYGDFQSAEMLRDNLGFAPPKFSNEFFQLLGAGDGIDQLTAVKLGFVSCICPFTGRYQTSKHGFPVVVGIENTIFYRFDSIQPYYLAVGGFTGRRAFIYIPGEELIIKLSQDVGLWAYAFYSCLALKYLTVSNGLKCSYYLEGETTKGIITGISNNLGHYFWNDISAVSNYFYADLLSDPIDLLVYHNAALSIQDLLSWRTPFSARFSAPEPLFQSTLQRRLLPIRLATLRLGARTAHNIVEYCQDRLTAGDRTEIERARQSSTLLFFNLRAHNKAWVDQIEGAVAIAQKAHETNRSLSLYLDGMPDCAEMAIEIMRRAPASVQVIQGFDRPLPVTIAWAAACDAYVATIGSGLTLLTWIAGKPGVAHSEHHHLTQMNFWPEVRPDVPQPTPVDAADVVEITPGSYGNYSIKPEVIVNLLWPLLPPI